MLVYPNYYPRFRCLAEDCRHSCCVGWEIDIDGEALMRYEAMRGTMGERLRRCIDRSGESPHFRLTPEGRCPLLNKTGLCDLILSEGEEALCQICTDHPRYRSFFSTRTEIGVGLCCEAAAELLLGQTEKVLLLSEGEPEPLTEEEEALLSLRQELMDILQDRRVPVSERAEIMLARVGGHIPAWRGKDLVEILRPLERLDPAWDRELDKLSLGAGALPAEPSWEIPQEQLLVYLLYRHLPGALEDGDIADRAAFAVLGWRTVAMLCAAHREVTGAVSFADMVEFARAYSAEIEYSDENTEALLDYLYEVI